MPKTTLTTSNKNVSFNPEVIMIRKVLPRINPSNTTLLLCDMQEKFRRTVAFFDAVVSNSRRLLEVAVKLEIPVKATEQYPAGLGPTVPELNFSTLGVTPIPKTRFSMMGSGLTVQTESVILCGIETHACILQTVYDLVEVDKSVFIPVECVSSRSQLDRKFALKTMESLPNVHLSTVETIVLEILKDSAHPKFRLLQEQIAQPSENTGVLPLID